MRKEFGLSNPVVDALLAEKKDEADLKPEMAETTKAKADIVGKAKAKIKDADAGKKRQPTSFVIPESLYRRAMKYVYAKKIDAPEEKTSLTGIVLKALEEYLDRNE